MADHPNVEQIRRLYDAFAALDLDAIVAIVDPDVEIFQTEELPSGGTFHGHTGLAEFFGKLRDNITSAVTHNAVYAAGDRVVQTGRTAGTVNATGVAFAIDEMHLFTLRDGKVIRFEAYIDTPAMLAALSQSV